MIKKISHTHLKGLTLLVAVAFFMEQLDSTIAVTALPNIAHTFNVHVTNVTIAMALYLLSLAIFLPIGGWLTRNIGPKRTLLTAISLFMLGSLACGLSKNIHFFMFAECLQGIGGALMVPVGRLFVMQHCEKQQFVKMMSLLVWPGLIAPVLGPPLGAWITTHLSWHWLFFVNVPIAVILFTLTGIFFPTASNNELTKTPFDWFGFLLTTLTFGSGLVFLDWISQAGLQQWQPWGFFILAIIASVLLIRHVQRHEPPILSIDAWKSTFGFRISIVSGCLFRCSIGGFPLLIPIFLQTQLGLSLIDSGTFVLMLFLGNVAMKPFTTKILMNWGFKWPLLISTGISALSIIGCWLGQSNIYLVGFALFINGLMRSLQFSGFNTLTFSDVPKQELNSANILNNLVNQSSFAVGIALISVFMRFGQHSTSLTAMPHSYSSGLSVTFWGLTVLAILPLFGLVRLRSIDGMTVR